MALIIFFVILSLLVLVHELGHFSVAKFFGIRVDEFGLGYPPRIRKLFNFKGTAFTLNWLPFGGFVKIFGENYSDTETAKDSFQNKNKGVQALVLVAGVVGNFLFAWFLLSVGFMTGLPAPESLGLPMTNSQTVITTVLPGSPADEAGLKSGDALLSLARGEQTLSSNLSPENTSAFITSSLEPVDLTIVRGNDRLVKKVTPIEGVWSETPAIGVAMEVVGLVDLPLAESIAQGFLISADLTVATAKGLGQFITQAFVGRADLSSVTGPVGLVGMVGDVSRLGFAHLLTFTALISINLSLINLLPFPALDGGRLLFVGIEAVTRRQIPARFFNLVNAAGFVLLILMMILITIHDVSNIF